MPETPQTNSADRRFIYIPAVARRYGKSRATIWRWISNGTLPEPVRITSSSVGYWLETLLEWEQGKLGRALGNADRGSV